MKATVKNIAQEAGVSHQAVSSILGRGAHLFRPETGQRVRDVALRLGYRPNYSARAMRNGRFNAIAVLMSREGEGRSTLFTGFLGGAEPAAHAAGLHLIVTALPDRQLTDPAFGPKLLREAMSDGLLVNYYVEVPAAMEEIVAEYRIPSIWTNARRAADCAYPDDYEASRRITRTLIQRGHRRVAYACGVFDQPLDPMHLHYSAFDRRDGYLAAMQEAGLPAHILPVTNKLQGAALIEALKHWLASLERPMAVVTYCDVEVDGILQAASALNLRLPQDLTLASFSEEPIHHGLTPMTTMLIPSENLGRISVEMLLKKIADPARALAPRPVQYGMHEGKA